MTVNNNNWLVVLSPTPLKKIRVSWDEIPNRWKNNPNVPNHQPDKIVFLTGMKALI